MPPSILLEKEPRYPMKPPHVSDLATLESIYFPEGDGPELGYMYRIYMLHQQLHKRLEDVLNPFELTPASFNLLMLVKHQGGEQGISQVRLSEGLLVSASNTTRMLERLENRSMITRTPNERDRRQLMIVITDKASNLLDDVWPHVLNVAKAISSPFDESETEALKLSLAKSSVALNLFMQNED
jgi:DNA-binding MarR family transcriptional regulator